MPISVRLVPDLALDFIRRAEGLVLTAKKDTGGILAIGYGHNVLPGDPSVITEATAEVYLRHDAGIAAYRLATVVDPQRLESLTNHEYSALISFVYNLGEKPEWTIWKDLNAGNLADVPDQIMRFDKGKIGGVLKVVPGLEHRRLAEKTLWLTGDVEAAVATVQAAPIAPPSSAVTRDIMDTPPAPPAKAFDMASLGTKVVTAATAVGATATQLQGIVAPHADVEILGKIATGLTMVVVTCSVIALLIHNAQSKA